MDKTSGWFQILGLATRLKNELFMYLLTAVRLAVWLFSEKLKNSLTLPYKPRGRTADASQWQSYSHPLLLPSPTNLQSPVVRKIIKITKAQESGCYPAPWDIFREVKGGTEPKQPVIMEIFSPNDNILLEMFYEELDNCRHIHNKHIKKKLPVSALKCPWELQSSSKQIPPPPLGRFIEYIDDIMADVLHSTILHRLGFFLKNTEESLNPAPLTQARIILNGTEIQFKPYLDKEAAGGFYDLKDELKGNIFVSAQVKRVAAHLGSEHYRVQPLLLCLQIMNLINCKGSQYITLASVLAKGEESSPRAGEAAPPSQTKSKGFYFILRLMVNQEFEILEKEMLLMQKSAELFQVAIPDKKNVKQCQKEAWLLETVGDTSVYINSSIDDGAKTQWRQFNVEQMDMELRRVTFSPDVAPGKLQELLTDTTNTKNVMEATTKPKAHEKLEALQHSFVQVTSIQAFARVSQLGCRWDDAQEHSFGNICDAQFQCFYEYLGNTPRLVITPLAGRFLFLDENLTLKSSVGIFSTMKPGYADQTELPESLDTLFRPWAVVVPDIELICGITLVAEGFVGACLVVRKRITLYILCFLRMFSQNHCGWRLNAIKSVVLVAGSLKPGDKNRPEDQVLVQALRDFNLPKIVTDDIPIFMGLISDLFPALDALRRNLQFEQMVKQSTLRLLLQPEESFILRVLTLTSKEHVPLAPSEQLPFEVRHFRAASPVMVSRGGVLCLNTQDLGWNPYIASWIETRRYQSKKADSTKCLEKAGHNCGPVGNKKLTYFIDDLSMSEVDGGTVQPQTMKEIHNCQYIACMNPAAGSFTINPRLQFRHEQLKMQTVFLVVVWSLAFWRYCANALSPDLHRCQISHVLETPRGYALLIGVGGSGKKSLLRLAAYICSLEVFQITLESLIQDLRVGLASLYIKTGAKNMRVVILLTDAQVPDERFCVLINDLLASEEVPDLFSDEGVEDIVTGVRKEIQALGLMDTRESHWRFFLKIALCFHPAGATLRVAWKFPAIVNCSSIDFHEWPQEARCSVSRRLIEEAEGVEVEDLKSELASPGAELQLRNQDVEALIVKIGFQTEKVSQENAIADAEEQKADDFQALINYDKECIQQNCLKVIKEHYLKDPDHVGTKFFAAAGLCAWVINVVEPEHCVLAQGNAELAAATEKTEDIRKKIIVLGSNLSKLTSSLEKAAAGKVQCQDDEITFSNTSLQFENMHWSQSVENLKAQKKTSCSDILLTAAFVFVSFTKQYCQKLMEYFWIRFLMSQEVPIPVTESSGPIATLTDDAATAAWSNKGLPGDRMSAGNVTILTNCMPWPLMIDSQQEGIKWIKNKYGADLKVVCLGQKGYTSIYIKTEDKECEFKKTHLILHTKVASPHYKPELQAQTTLINFSVTRDGLEDQLLAEVVSAERPGLEKCQVVVRDLASTSVAVVLRRIMKNENCKEIEFLELDFLLRFGVQHTYKSPVDLTTQSWSAIRAMAVMDVFRGLDNNLERPTEGRRNEWTQNIQKNNNSPVCVSTKKTQDLKRNFGKENLDSIYMKRTKMDLSKSYEESSPANPGFILSPGVDPFEDTETGKKLGFTMDSGRFHNISSRQGQEMFAEEALKKVARHGHGILLQGGNFLLTSARGRSRSECKTGGEAEGNPEGDRAREYSSSNEEGHPDFCVFIIAEPPPTLEEHIIPQGILENSIKITSEPPTGVLGNLHTALHSSDQDTLELCMGEGEFQSILFFFFPLCYLHTCVAGRLKFGPRGSNGRCPFCAGGVTVCSRVLCGHLETGTKMNSTTVTSASEGLILPHCPTLPLCLLIPMRMFLELSSNVVSFLAASNLDCAGYHKYIKMLPSERPVLYRLHPSAEMGYLTATSDNVFKTLLETQPMNSFAEGSSWFAEVKVKNILDDFLVKLPNEFNVAETPQAIIASGPYALVCLPACVRMNLLLSEIRKSQTDGHQSEGKIRHPLMRYGAFGIQTQDLEPPAAVWLSGLFNPSFLTGVLDSRCYQKDQMITVTHKEKDPPSVDFSSKV
ncbi:LOW QUALITY PROTEIN: dynein axonemal heavy chain 11 [Porphyrio hochstetteri]